MARPVARYISADGSMQESRGWGLFTITEGFWSAVNVMSNFFSTLVNPSPTSESLKDHRRRNPTRYVQSPSNGGRRSLGHVAGFGSGAQQIPMATG